MSNQELIEQFLAVASRAEKTGKCKVTIIGAMETAKAGVLQLTIGLKAADAPAIVPATLSGLPVHRRD